MERFVQFKKRFKFAGLLLTIQDVEKLGEGIATVLFLVFMISCLLLSLKDVHVCQGFPRRTQRPDPRL